MFKIIRKKLLHYFFFFFSKSSIAPFLLRQLKNSKTNFFDDKSDGLEINNFKSKFFGKIARYYEGDEIKITKKFYFQNSFIMDLKINEFTQNGYFFNIPHNGLGTLMKLLENKVFIDIGANVGIFSLMASQVFNDVYSFEPMKENYELLENNLKINQISNVYLYNHALGKAESFGELITNNFNNGGTSVQVLKKKNKDTIKILALDQFNFKNVDLIKIDVEGSELEVLEGLKKIKDKFCPTFFIEISSSMDNVRKISDVLGRDYYAFYPPNNNLISNDMIFVHRNNLSLVINLNKFDL